MEINSTLASQSASLLRTAEQDPGTASTLLKKALNSDKNLVETLLPTPPPQPVPGTGSLNLHA